MIFMGIPFIFSVSFSLTYGTVQAVMSIECFGSKHPATCHCVNRKGNQINRSTKDSATASNNPNRPICINVSLLLPNDIKNTNKS